MTDETNNIRVLLVDDHTILRQGLQQLLETESRIQVCGTAGNGEEAIFQALSLKPDVILMDINLPKVSGYEASRAILTAWPTARIIVLTNQDDAVVMKKFLDLGIRGFLLKDIPAEQLVSGIYEVMDGKTIDLSSELAEKLKVAQNASTHDPLSDLTEREQEVLRALSKGYSNQQLADLLTVSPKTVHNHLYNIYSKIGVSTRAEAIVWAIEKGLNQRS